MRLNHKCVGVLLSVLTIGSAVVTDLNAMTRPWSYVKVPGSYFGSIITEKRVDLHLRQVPGPLPEKLTYSPIGQRVNYDTYLLCDQRGPGGCIVPTARVAVKLGELGNRSIEEIVACNIMQSEFAYNSQEYTLNYVPANEDYGYSIHEHVLVKINGTGIHYDERYVRVLPEHEPGVIDLQVDLSPLLGRGIVAPAAPVAAAPVAAPAPAAPPVVVASGTVINVPDSITNTAGRNFYVEHDVNRNLYFGMELLTPENIGWWQRRLAYDAYFHFESHAQSGSSEMPPTDEQRDAERMYSGFTHEINQNQTFMLLFRKASEHREVSSYDKDLASAFRGFAYNIEHYTEGGNGATWVAYVSSRPVNGPLCLERGFDVASPDIKMAITVKISDPFYSPLGIFRSPIANAFDKEAKAGTKNLSMLLHSYIARTVLQIRPSVKYMIVRPLASMMSIFRSSGMPCSISDCGQIQDGMPRIRWEGGGHGWYYQPIVNFTLVEPQSNTIYKISESHWFSTSPFLGGPCESEFFEQYPFVTIDCRALGAYH